MEPTATGVPRGLCVLHKPPDSQGRTRAELMTRLSSTHFNFSAESIAFMDEAIRKSGLGDVTYVPEGIFKDPPNLTFPEALREARAVIFGSVEELLTKTGVRGGDIGVVIVNCTVFCPVPSLAAMIVNRFGFGEGVRCYNLQGMGCTASLSAVGLAKHLLQRRRHHRTEDIVAPAQKVHDNTYALIVSTENITQSCYQGNDPSMNDRCQLSVSRWWGRHPSL